MARSRPNRAGKRPPAEAPGAPESSPPASLPSLASLLHLLALVIIVLAMSPITRNLDNIKMMLYLASGPAILIAVFASASRGSLHLPPYSLLVGWLAYLGVASLSTLLSEHRWAGPHELLFLWASLGFCLGEYAQAVSRSGFRVVLVGLTGLLFVVNLFGFFQFDLFGTGSTGVTLFQSLAGLEASDLHSGDTALKTLLHTFATRGSDSLMSTILNRDFYAAFCLLFLGFPLSLGMMSRSPGVRAFAFSTVGMSLLSILLCQSKGEYIALIASAVLFAGFMFMGGWRPSRQLKKTALWLPGPLVFVATLVLVKSPFVLGQLKSLEDSFRSRLIIFRGAFDIFREFPWLGGGPGTFKIYFPNFRSPDYFEWGISNVTNFSHNYFLDALSETGLLGFIALLSILLPVAFLSLKKLAENDDPRLTIPVAALLACSMGFLVSNMTSVSARWPIGAVGFWTVVGMLSGLSQSIDSAPISLNTTKKEAARGSDPVTEKRRIDPRRIVTLTVLGFSILIFPFAVRNAITYWRSQVVFAKGYLLAEKYRDFAIQSIYGNQDIAQEQQEMLVQKLSQATDHLDQARQMDPSLLTAYYHLGSAESLLAGLDPRKNEEHLKASLAAFEDLGRLAPDYAELPYNLGIVHYQYALNIEQVLELLPPDKDELRRQFESELAFHRQAALDGFERMGQLSNRAEVLLNLGESYSRVNRPDRALDIYRKGFELYPERGRFAERVLAMGMILDEPQAIIDAQLALWRLSPLNLNLVLGSDGALARLLEMDRQEEFEAAADEMAERIPIDPKLHGFRARAAHQWGTKEELALAVSRYRKLGGTDAAILGLGSE